MQNARFFEDKFESGEWDEDTFLTELPYVGPYIEARLRRALRRRNDAAAAAAAAGPMTVGEFVVSFRGMHSPRVAHILQRALQNRRGNQCVSPRPERDGYHVGDVNEYGYEVLARLLEHARRSRIFQAGLRFTAPLPRLERRAASARKCGCKKRGECVGACVWVDEGCFPRDTRSKGFTGTPYHPSQVVHAPTEADRSRVRRSSTTSLTSHLRSDADSVSDINAGHSRRLSYVRRGSKMWRRPGSKVRLPVRA
jgi:hypothetical protein